MICPGDADSDDFVATVGRLVAVETFRLQLLRKNVMRMEKGRRKKIRVRDIKGEELLLPFPLEKGPGMKMVYS